MADIKQFKKLIGTLESNNDPTVRHPAATKGVNAGDTAIGEHGLMPNTIKEFANRAKLKNQNNISDDIIAESPNDQVTEMLQNNPELMKLYVDRIGKHVMGNSDNKQDDAYFRWVYGHNLPTNRVNDIKENDPKTLKRIQQALKLQQNVPADIIDIPEEPYIDKPFTPMRKK